MTFPANHIIGSPGHTDDHNTIETDLNDNNADIAALQADVATRAVDSAVVHDTGNETITGVKDFTGSLQKSGNDVLTESLLGAKGSLIGASAPGVPGELTTAGSSDDDVLTRDASATLGFRWAAAVGGGATSTTDCIWLDDFAGANDGAKLTAAAASIAADTYKRTIRLTPRLHTFTVPFTIPFPHFKLAGPPGHSNPERGSDDTHVEVQALMSNDIFLKVDPTGIGSGSNVFGVFIEGIAFVGDSDTQWIGHVSGTGLYQAVFRNLYFSSFKSVLGSQAAKLLITACHFEGDWEINNSYNGAIHIGGSDNSFSWDCLLDSSTAHNAAGSATGQAHLYCDSLEKTSFGGRMYITCEGGWAGIRIDGPAYNATTASNLAGPITFYAPVIEGRNKDAPCNGAPVRVRGGQCVFVSPSINFGMASAASMGHSPTDLALFDVALDGSAVLYAPQFDRATANTEGTLNCVNVAAGGQLRVKDARVGTKGGTWAAAPRAKDSGGLLVTDDSMQPV